MNDSDFHHYAYVRRTFTGKPVNSSGLPLTIGARTNDSAPTGFSGHFSGIVDEVEVLNYALSDAEIKAIYDAGSAGKIKP